MSSLGIAIGLGNAAGQLAPTIPVALDFQNQRYWLGSASTKVLSQLAGFAYSRPGYNLIPYSSDPSAVTWNGSIGGTKTSGLADAVGGMTAARFTADGTNVLHYIAPGNGWLTYTAGATYAEAIDIKAETQSIVQILAPSAQFGAAAYCNFNVSTGVIGSSAGMVVTPTIVSLGNGWYRCFVAMLATNSATGANGLIVAPVTSLTSARGESNTLTTSFLVARPQIEPGTVANAYQPTGATALTFAPIATADGLIDDVATNKVTIYNANPTEAAGFVGTPAGFNKYGDAASVLSVVDDAAELAKVPELAAICTSGKVYKFDNSAGVGAAGISIAGQTGNTNTHTATLWARRLPGASTCVWGGGGSWTAAVNITSPGYTRVSVTSAPPATNNSTQVLIGAGTVVYFILPGLYERSTPITQDVVTEGASASGVVGQVEGIVSFPANVPRVTSRGIWDEEARTNLTPNSADVTGRTTGSPTVGAGEIGPLGVAGQVIGWPSGSFVTTGANISAVADNTAFTAYFVAKYVNHAWHRIVTFDKAGTQVNTYLNVQTRAFGTLGSGITVQVRPLANGWAIYAVTRASSATGAGTAATQIRPCDGDNNNTYSGTSANQTLLAHSQFEAGGSALSLIPTFGVALTRAADPSWIDGLPDYLGKFRTNLLRRSNDFTNAYWDKTGNGTGTPPAITPNAFPDPDGGNAASRIVFDRGAGRTSSDHSLLSKAVGTSIKATNSIWVMADAPTKLLFRNPQNTGLWSYINVTTAWQRIEATGTPAGSNLFQMGVRGDQLFTDDTATVYVYEAQAEYAPAATANIHTDADPVTVGEPFTVYYEADLPAIDGTVRGLGQVNDGTPTNRIDLRRSAANEAIFPTTVANTQTVRTGPGGKTGARILKMAVRQRKNTQAFAVDGQLFADVVQAAPTGLNRLEIGYRPPSLDHLNGAIRRIQIAKNTTDAQLKRFTTTGYPIKEPGDSTETLLRILLLGF